MFTIMCLCLQSARLQLSGLISSAQRPHATITIEMLLTHSAGLPREAADWPYWSPPDFKFPTAEGAPRNGQRLLSAPEARKRPLALRPQDGKRPRALQPPRDQGLQQVSVGLRETIGF